jgi:hypothetical protein
MVSREEANTINYNIRELRKFLTNPPSGVFENGKLITPSTDLGKKVIDLFTAFRTAFDNKDRLCIEKMKDLQKVL